MIIARPGRYGLVCGVLAAVAMGSSGPGNMAAGSMPIEPADKQPSHAQTAGAADLVIKDASAELKRTQVTAYLSREHVTGQSLLWCATFQIAWDQFPGLLKAPLTLMGDPPMAVELNTSPWKTGELDAGSYVAQIGIGPGTVDAIKAALDKTFKGKASPAVLPSPGDIGPHDFLAYAYLFKNLAFEHPLTKREHGMMFVEGGDMASQVRGFAIGRDTEGWAKVAAQVTVHHYGGPDDFVIELATKEKADRLIIARLKPGKTLKETVAAAMAGTGEKNDAPRLHDDEPVEIPVLNFDVTRKYGEIIGRVITTPIPPELTGIKEYQIGEAMQNIRFRLDEKGAILKSDATIIATPTSVASPGGRVPRRFVCDGPFLVLMAREGAATPYFAAWIESAELLVPLK
jgi:hypothetical protein